MASFFSFHFSSVYGQDEGLAKNRFIMEVVYRQIALCIDYTHMVTFIHVGMMTCFFFLSPMQLINGLGLLFFWA
jgi:hypothetical protein